MSDESFMRLALAEAMAARSEGNMPVGSVVIRNEAMIGAGHNVVRTTGDITAHAEIMAIRHATAAIGSGDLNGTTLYTTFEPCPMCCGTILLANVRTIVLGGRIFEEFRRYPGYSVERLIDLASWSEHLIVRDGVFAREGEDLLRAWVREMGVTPLPSGH